MKTGSWLVIAVAMVTGCFDEGGDAARTQAAITTAQGLIAFGDIQSNLTTDPAKAGEALLEFIKWPVAADSLVSPPFAEAAAVMDASPRLAPALPVPDCLLQSGEPACESYSTVDTCEAGGFTFTGFMNRKCAKCDDPRGLCAYGWVLPELKYVSTRFTLSMRTAGSWIGSTSQITPNLSAQYELETPGREGDLRHAGTLSACACTVFTVEDGPPPTGKPRKLVNSSFVVRAATVGAERCALVKFDGNGNPSIDNKCTCDNTTICEPAIDETFASCPADCPLAPAVCDNNICEIGEDSTTCALDCGFVTP
jgi:hypothetical protein